MKYALLLSGGMDSIAIAYWICPEVGITVEYGQRGLRHVPRLQKALRDFAGTGSRSILTTGFYSTMMRVVALIV